MSTGTTTSDKMMSYSTTVQPAVADFTDNVSLVTTTGFSAAKYTEVYKQPSAAAVAAGSSAAAGTATGADMAKYTYSVTLNKLDSTQKINTAAFEYTSMEAGVGETNNALILLKADYKRTFAAVYSKIGTVLVTQKELLDLNNGALSLASAAAGIAILSMAL